MWERSFLFVPGNKPERFEKALNSGADAIIIDLEDGVPEYQKEFARDQVANWLSSENPIFVRINGVETLWFQDDLEAIQRPGLLGVFLPKAENGEQIHLIRKRIGDVPIFPTIETGLGLWNVMEIASAAQVQRLAFGSVDFQLDMNIKGEHEELLFARSKIILASRVASIEPPIDGVTTEIENEDKLSLDVSRSRSIGFAGKLCIHPRQVGAINQGFLPDEKEIKWAKGVMEVARKSGGAATRLQNELVDKPVIEKARKILERAEMPPFIGSKIE